MVARNVAKTEKSIGISNAEMAIPASRLKRFTAAEYNRMADKGAFAPDDRMELIEGYLVEKMTQNGPHSFATAMLVQLLIPMLRPPWVLRCQAPILLSGDNVPEPDVAIVRGPMRKFAKVHPKAPDIPLVIEVSDSTLELDCGTKQKIYARDHIPQYWIVNLVDRVVEVYTHPKAGKSPSYRQMVSYAPGASVPVRIQDVELGVINVSDILP